MKSKASFCVPLLTTLLLSSCNFGEVSKEKFEDHISHLESHQYSKVVISASLKDSENGEHSARQTLTYNAEAETWVHQSGDELMDGSYIELNKVDVIYPEFLDIYTASSEVLRIHYYIYPIKVVLNGSEDVTETIDEEEVTYHVTYYQAFIANKYGYLTSYRVEITSNGDYYKLKYTFQWS